MRIKDVIPFSYLAIVLLFTSGCPCSTSDPVCRKGGTETCKAVHATGGFGLGPESKSTLNSNPSITNSDIMSIIDEHDYFTQTTINNFNVYVDMSAGL